MQLNCFIEYPAALRGAHNRHIFYVQSGCSAYCALHSSSQKQFFKHF